ASRPAQLPFLGSSVIRPLNASQRLPGHVLTGGEDFVALYHGKWGHGKRAGLMFFTRHFLRIFSRFWPNSTIPESR
ncbi:MAG: hypothetical protein ACLPPF_08810, partial [Rhodomicrobium sp.]